MGKQTPKTNKSDDEVVQEEEIVSEAPEKEEEKASEGLKKRAAKKGSSEEKKEAESSVSSGSERKVRKRTVEKKKSPEVSICFKLAVVLVVSLVTYFAWSFFNDGPVHAGLRKMPALVVDHLDSGSYIPIHDKTQALRVFLHQEGAGKSKEAVLLIHGLTSTSFSYRKVAQHLSEQKVRVVSFDFPGMGLSEPPAQGDIDWHYLADRVGDVVEALQISKVHLVLQDIGGPIGLEYALKNPHRIGSITFANAVVDLAKYSLPFPASLYTTPYIGPIAAWISSNPAFAPLSWLFYRMFASNVVSLGEVQAYSYLLGKGNKGAGLLQVAAGSVTTPEHTEYLLKGLANVKFSTMAIWSTDSILPHSQHQLDTIKKLSNPVAVHELSSKHYVQEDRPKEFSKLLVSFVRSVTKAFPEKEETHAHSHAHGDAGHSHSHAHGDAGHSHSHAHSDAGHSHSHSHSDAGHSHSHSHGDAGHSHGHSHENAGHSHGHSHGHGDDAYGAGHNYGL